MAHPRLLKDPATVNSRIFIGHLQTDDLNRNELEDQFSKYGTIVGVSLNRGFGFIQFETEQAAIDAINNENGTMFKGRRIDVKPAKKDGPNVGGVGGGGTGGPSPFGSNNDSFNNSSGFGGGNNQSFGNNRSFGNNDQFGRGMSNNSFNNDQNPDDQNNRNNTDNNSPFGNNRGSLSGNQNETRNRGKNNLDGNMDRNMGGNMKRGMGGGMDRGMGGGIDRGMGMDRGLGSGGMDRGMGMGNMDRDMDRGMGRGMDRGMGPGLGLGGPGRDMGGPGPIGGLGRGIGDNMGGNFRDRSPLGRSGRMDDKPLGNWEHNKPGGNMRGGFGDFGGPKNRYDDFKGPNRDGPSFGRPPPPSDYPSIAAEKNDCEIIVVNKSLTEYAEVIESRLKKLGLTVDLLFPNEEVPLSRVLGNIASRGCLYAIVIMPTNMEHRSLTLNILHGLPQEHRNMPVEDAITLIMRDFKNYKSGGRSIPCNAQPAAESHPDAIQVLLNMLADNLQLTVLQYERVIKYLEVRREEQVQFELGEDAKDLGGLGVNDPKQAELQSRILNILNSNKSGPPNSSVKSGPPNSSAMSGVSPSPVPPPTVSTNSSNNTTSTSNTVTPSPLLNDPTVQKALDSLLQGNLLKNIGDQSTPTSSATPLFAAFPNMNRY